MTAAQNVKSEWSGIDVRDFGPYREALAARLGQRLWSDAGLRRRLAEAPETYFGETGLSAPDGMDLRVIDKGVDEFVFVVPRVPPEVELWYRYEQISDWWMLAHGFYWWMRREHGDAVDPFLGALGVTSGGRGPIRTGATRCWTIPAPRWSARPAARSTPISRCARSRRPTPSSSSCPPTPPRSAWATGQRTMPASSPWPTRGGNGWSGPA